MAQPKIVSLHYYPIKSCGGLEARSLTVGPRGPQWDRTWMIVDSESGHYLSQRQHAKMALIRPEITQDKMKVTVGSSSFEVDLHSTEGKSHPRETVRIWSDDCAAFDEGRESSDVISDFLGAKVRLVRMAPEFKRMLPEKYQTPGAHTGFADGMPFLMTSVNSLNDVANRVGAKIPMDRFRPNLVIEGFDPYSEDTWKRLKIGSIEFKVAKSCARCVIINIDQETAQRGTEPLKTLATYRRDGNKVLFGQYLIHLQEGKLQVGDSVEVIG